MVLTVSLYHADPVPSSNDTFVALTLQLALQLVAL